MEKRDEGALKLLQQKNEGIEMKNCSFTVMVFNRQPDEALALCSQGSWVSISVLLLAS